MSEQNPQSEPTTGQRETRPKKMVSRNVAVALGIICIVLVASLAGTTVYLVSVVNDKNSTINQNDSAIADLNNTVNDLNNMVNLQKQDAWVNNQTITQPPDSYNSWTFPVNVSGYILVFTTSTNNNTYVRVIYGAIVPVMGLIVLANGTAVISFQGATWNIAYDNQVNATSQEEPYGLPPVSLWGVFPVLSSYYTPKTLGLFPPPPINWTSVEVRVGNTNLIGNTTQTVTIVYYY